MYDARQKISWWDILCTRTTDGSLAFLSTNLGQHVTNGVLQELVFSLGRIV